MQTQRTWRLPFVLVIAAVVLPLAVPGVAHAAVGRSCTNEQYEWRGKFQLAAGQTFFTGVQVPIVVGTEVVLLGSSSSADPFATSIVNVLVGGQAALEEAVVVGGELAAMNLGFAPFELTTVGVAVRRCSQVAQLRVVSGPDLTVELPATGPNMPITVAATLTVAMLTTGVGLWMLFAGRRPARRGQPWSS